MLGKYVIIRCKEAGIHAGILKSKEGNEVMLTQSRRLWFWAGAASISQLAKSGTTKPDECKFAVELEEITLLGVIEIIPCTSKAIQSIQSCSEWEV